MWILLLFLPVMISGDYTTCITNSTNGTGLVSPLQAKPRPFNLVLAGPVYNASTDILSCNFSKTYLPTILGFSALANLNAAVPANNVFTATLLDPAQLFINETANIRLYFCYEKTAFHSTFIVNYKPAPYEGKIVFPDATWKDSFTGAIVNPGDWVLFQNYPGQTRIQFLMVSNGAYGGDVVFATDQSVDEDGAPHFRVYLIDGTSYLLICYEDAYGGGNSDFSDIIIVADIGKNNANALSQYKQGKYNPPFLYPTTTTAPAPTTTAVPMATTADAAHVCKNYPSNSTVTSTATTTTPAVLKICITSGVVSVLIQSYDGSGNRLFVGPESVSITVVGFHVASGTTIQGLAQAGSVVGQMSFVRYVGFSGDMDIYVWPLSCSLNWAATSSLMCTAYNGVV